MIDKHIKKAKVKVQHIVNSFEGGIQMDDGIVILSGRANGKLANDICNCYGTKLGKAYVGKFPDSETSIRIDENVRGKDVFVIQPTCANANDHLMELLIMIDALKRASAKRITAVMPYFGYARQDRKYRSREPITAKLVADLLITAGANRVLTIDLHASQIQGFFSIPLDHLYGSVIFIDYIKSLKLKKIVIASTDLGGSKMVGAYAEYLGGEVVVIDKRRDSATHTEVVKIVGKVRGKSVVIADDIISTAGSLAGAVEALKKAGAKEVRAVMTHAVLCGPALERVKKCGLKELMITDTIPLSKSKKLKVITVLSVAPLLAEAIKRIHEEQSISPLLEYKPK